MPEIQIVALGLSLLVDRNRFSPRSAERHLCEGGVCTESPSIICKRN